VLPALLLKAHRAKVEGQQALEIWGTGTPRREFLYVDDLADALVHVMKTYSEEEPLNVGAGYDVTIAEVAQTIMRVVGLAARLRFDCSKPDGTPRKLLDSGRLQKMGWTPAISLEEGVQKLYAWFLETARVVP
jgi:GDP-L-fucose synthase